MSHKITLIIPAYHADSELYEITKACLDSVWADDLQLILVADNQPYTVNVNAGLRAATGDIIVIGNNDLVFHEGWLTQLLPLLDSEYDIATCWTSDQKFHIENLIEEQAKFGSLFAMRRRVYDTLGDFDEQFKGYFSDLDYRQRAMEAGFRIGKNLSLVVEHKAKSTYLKVDPEDKEFERSRRLYEAKYGAVD